ncbi:branched-chain amino acid ABC transporter permease [Caballeronia sp. LZ065]|uniref:branched-chain amino acid ABC transporter permease n=1 Tax=Caballeronia sp. LZ065 TaxID=3038571 RepID=UPI00285935DF|nr:branched-chain amino acid ABC transporter permease [Caballeronia sp. LZ065]MDR5784623.1 branched-chain amino acid ABC transporter permease [Caballeronia sp. LZ065]
MAESFIQRVTRRVGAAEMVLLVVLFACFMVPALTASPSLVSLLSQILIALIGALAVYIMMRMDLMTFGVPAFMAVGAYAGAIMSLDHGVTNLLALAGISFIVPMLIALPLGWMVLRLSGVYFVLVTFVIAEIVPLVLFETSSLTGGANGLAGLPAPVLMGWTVQDNRAVLQMAIGVALLCAIVTVALTRALRRQFAAIEEDPVLAQSLGLVVWKHKVIGFCVAAGISGLGGFVLVNMLLTAHPSSFSAISSVNYIAYAIVGGRASILGPLVGSTLLVWATNLFSFEGQYSQGLFGLLLMVVVLATKGGIVGLAMSVWPPLAHRFRHRASAVSAAAPPQAAPQGDK